MVRFIQFLFAIIVAFLLASCYSLPPKNESGKSLWNPVNWPIFSDEKEEQKEEKEPVVIHGKGFSIGYEWGVFMMIGGGLMAWLPVFGTRTGFGLAATGLTLIITLQILESIPGWIMAISGIVLLITIIWDGIKFNPVGRFLSHKRKLRRGDASKWNLKKS